MTTADFVERFGEFLGRNGRDGTASPWIFVERYEALIDAAEEGYRWGFYEWNNELAVRDLLQKAIDDATLRQFEPMVAVRARVDAADPRLKALFLPEAQIGGTDDPWWRRGVLARAGEEYVGDVARLYGIEVRTAS